MYVLLIITFIISLVATYNDKGGLLTLVAFFLKWYLLSDKFTQLESIQISLVQVDLEQIKYTIKSTFLDQIEM